MRGLVSGVFRFLLIYLCVGLPFVAQAAEMGKFSYHSFKKPTSCKGCHNVIYQEWRQSLMSQAYTHEWDQAEYFKLALPHSQKLEKVSGVKAGCIACHGPLAFLSGDIPPKTAAEDTRVNEGVSCEICHHITGSSEEIPYNFSFNIKPGKVMSGPRKDAKPSGHKVVYSAFLKSSEFCATCHDEQSPYGAWVKSTYREWKAGPYAKEGTRCQDCHMYRAEGKAASMGKVRADFAHHVFHGSHNSAKLAGAVDMAIYVKRASVSKDSTLRFRIELFNGKVGHYIPSGSSEERMLWLEVWAVDARGHRYAIPVAKKGFDYEEYTIADSSALAYQAMGEIMDINGFAGISRDGMVPDGARIFRRPFFDPKGRMTICQWYTMENTKVDYRIGPRETKIENFVWKLPSGIPSGDLKIEARLLYSQVPSSLGEFFKLPADEYAPILVNQVETAVKIK